MKKLRIVLIALILILGGAVFTKVYAADRNLGVSLTRQNGKYQYAVPPENLNLKYTLVKIYDNLDSNKALYCLRGGIGFGARDVSETTVRYTELGEMHTKAKDVIERYNALYEINLDRTEQIEGRNVNEYKSVNIYNAILWILDESYLRSDRFNNQNSKVYDAAEYKSELLDKAGVPNSQKAEITTDDIEVIQQLAIWYFSNYDQQPNAQTQPTVSQATKFPAQFLSITGNNNLSTTRKNNLNRLYQYLIYGAIDNSSSYTVNSSTKARTKTIETNKFDKTTPISVSSLNTYGLFSYYEIGPVKLDRNGTSNTNVRVDASDIVLYDAQGNAIPKYVETSATKYPVYRFVEGNTEVTELVKGANYYIRFYQAFEKGSNLIPSIESEDQYDISRITLRVSSSYTLASAKFLYNSSSDQPVVEIEKEKISEGDEITTQVYDLSLRKFITSINGTAYNRVPRIDLSKLNTIDSRTNQKITTAKYTHSKDAIQVKKGDTVVYTIRVYNEGEIDGKALKVTDYLPEGLELKEGSTINSSYGWTTTNGKEIVTEYLKNTVIKAYDPQKTSGDNAVWQKAEVGSSGLYYADLKVECKVVAEAGSSDKSLRNIAEITADNGDDRDSTPSNVNRSSYTPPEDNSTYQEDDDDFEILVIKGKKFDLSLRKFISKVERINGQTSQREELSISSREPVIKIAGLKSGNSTTATYVHPKNTLALKRGDIITYTIRVYNEGEIDGYATLVSDYLPEGLELVEGENDIWTQNGNKITTDALKEQKILAYDKTKTTASQGWQKASDDQTGLYYFDLTVVCRIKDNVADGAILKNVAEIYTDRSEGTDIDDKDSQPGNVYADNKHQPGQETEEGYTPGEQDDDDFESITVEPNRVFDLALRKYIVSVDGVALSGEESRIPNINTVPLTQSGTTAQYKHRKDPVEVEIGNVVTYRFTVYNEGEVDGRVYTIVDYLPEGLEFDATINESEEYNFTVEGNKLTITSKTNNYLFDLESFNGTTLDNKSIDVKLRVAVEESNNNQILTNVATMTYTPKTEILTDRDSNGNAFSIPSAERLVENTLPGYKGNESNKDNLTDSTYHYAGQEDDDDFEKVIIKGKEFDLSLRKFITSIRRNGEEVTIDDRTPSIDTTTLINGTYTRNGNQEYTATYTHSKEPLIVKKGDIITYTIRVYNEGERAGFASQITDYIPEGLALILDYNTNFNNGWKLPENVEKIDLIGENGFYKTQEEVKNFDLDDFSMTESLKDVKLVTGNVEITTNKLNDKLINAFDRNKTEEEIGWQKADNGDGGLYYKDVEVSCLVIAENTYQDMITNIAEISEDKDKNGNDVIDRDSTPDNINNPYTIWEEDDDDFEPVILRCFDLALRKFITGVETNGNLTDITYREPEVSIDEETGNLKYTHPKEEDPVSVANNDIVIYTLRVYNEGTLAGYAEEIADDIPEGLVYLPNHDINKKYEWEMYDEDGNKTENLEDAKTIKTTYLSKAKETEERQNIINPFDFTEELNTNNPEYKDIKVAFRVVEQNTSDRTIINSAQISKDSDDDEDSIPGKWNDGEDDQDKEYIYVKYFDLSLLKWVTKTVVSVDGKTTTTETGFKPNTGKTETKGIRENTENEPVAKVEVDRKKLDKTTVKFVYKIRVTNEGEIAGYATEITDYIPSGLEFKAEDNKQYGWTETEDNKVKTRALETKLLQPGESAELEIVFTWKNDKNNLGVKTNIAEITEDYNEHNSEDIDSTPNNRKNPYEKEQEDDDDFALVVLSLKTGKGISYTALVLTVVAMLTTGVFLIKKYVLTY